ncbi:MAG: VOC family protein [Clostridiales bacterium]|nr:VOC family protein [Clostridiales bacterium]
MEPIISGIQQIGVGIPDVYGAWDWYRQALGFDVPVFDDPGVAGNMTRYTGGKAQSRHAVLAINLQGGGGMEIWQYTSRQPQPADFAIQMGDLGIYAAIIKTQDIDSAYEALSKQENCVIGAVEKTPEGGRAFYIRDPYGNIFRIEQADGYFMDTGAATAGIAGCVIGVSDMDASMRFYREILGYDAVLYDRSGQFDDIAMLPGGGTPFRRVRLGHGKPRMGAFSRLLGATHIELVQALGRKPVRIFENRYWGDLGFIHLCLDINGMTHMRALCKEKGSPFTVDSNPEEGTFDMGEAAGHFSYIEDPDGTLIEFVETHKVPILKKIGWYLDLRKRNPKKPLPNWMLRTMKWSRKR